MKSFIFFLLFLSQTLLASEIDREWLNLLKYKKTITGYKSQVDDKDFFISSKGRSSPLEEYNDNLKEFHKENLQYICKYPARFKYFMAKTGLQNKRTLLAGCKKYQEFYKNHYPKKVSLIFSSYYVESPASAFGHTFLRFSKGENDSTDKETELLDIGINYGAVVTTTNPVLYTIFGVIGGFKGTFSSIPYFYKIREYNDYESRDLWSYELNLSELEKERLLDHLWELGGSWYYYYFFTGNCSQKILELLDYITPNWNFLEKLPFYIIPAETVKVVAQTPGLVKAVHFRPSKRRLFQNAYSQLDHQEKKTFEKIINTNSYIPIEETSEKAKAKVLDTVIEFTDYKHSKEILLEKGAIYEWKENILKRRSAVREKGIDLTPPTPLKEQPHLSHPPRKIRAAYQREEKKDSLFLSHRFALHDFSDPTIGSPALSTITFFKTDFLVNKNKFALREFSPVEVMSLNPWGNYFYPLSLYGKIDYTQETNKLASNAHTFNGRVASGPSWSIFRDQMVVYFLFNSQLTYAKKYSKELDLALGPLTGFIFRPTERINFISKASWGYYLRNSTWIYQIENGFYYHMLSNLSLALNYDRFDKSDRYSLGLNFYY